MKEIKKINITISGEQEQLATIAQFLRTVEYLGNVGATRELKLWVDGDGAARLRVNFGDTDVSKIEIPNIDGELSFEID